MLQLKRILFCLVVVSTFLFSCTTSKEMVYMNDLKSDTTKIENLLKAKYEFESLIQKNDQLWISVGGPNSQDLIALNSGLGLPVGGGNAVNQVGSQIVGFLVEADGTIKLPYIGKIKAEGLTRLQLEEVLKKEFELYTKDPTVNVRFINYKVTVMGEVARPGVINIPNERITILEAIGMVGDLTVMGKRNEILIIREVNGERTIGRVNLLSKELLNSPYYYLKTNDVVYVEPAPARFFARERLPQFLTLAASSLSLLLTIVTLTRL